MIDVGVGAALGDLDDFTTDSNVSVWIIGILNAERDMSVLPHVLVLHAALGAIEQDIVAIEFTPDRTDVRSSVLHQRRNMSKCLLLKQIFEIFWNPSHTNLPWC